MYKSLRWFENSEEEKASKSSVPSSKRPHWQLLVGLKGMILVLADGRSLGTVQAGEIVAVLPEGVSEVHTPPFQLLGVVRRHVGELPEDVQVRGVS